MEQQRWACRPLSFISFSFFSRPHRRREKNERKEESPSILLHSISQFDFTIIHQMEIEEKLGTFSLFFLLSSSLCGAMAALQPITPHKRRKKNKLHSHQLACSPLTDAQSLRNQFNLIAAFSHSPHFFCSIAHSVGLFGCLSSLCGAVAGAPALNPHKKETNKPTSFCNTAARRTHSISFL